MKYFTKSILHYQLESKSLICIYFFTNILLILLIVEKAKKNKKNVKFAATSRDRRLY